MKNKKLNISIGIFLLIILIIIIGNIDAHNKKLDILLKNQGFVSKKDSNYYKLQLSKLNLDDYNKKTKNKQNATFSIVNFDTESLQISKTKMDYQEEVSSVYNVTYSYENNEINYTARFTFSTANVIVKGNYQEKKNIFNCEIDFSYDVVTQNIKESLCSKAKFETLSFTQDKNKLFTKEINNIIKNILNQNNEE